MTSQRSETSSVPSLVIKFTLTHLEVAKLTLPVTAPLVVQVHDVGRPLIQSVKDMRRINYGGTPGFSLLAEPQEEVLTDADVEGGSNLVEEEDIEWPKVS